MSCAKRMIGLGEGTMPASFDEQLIGAKAGEIREFDFEAKDESGSSDFGDGDRLSHPKFGEGLVISVKGGAVTVAFDSVGIKKLALDFAPLKKI